MRIYNKQREDFEHEEDFNAYMEEVEDIIFNLVEGIDVPETESKIHEYQRLNRAKISLNSARKEEERKEYITMVREKDIDLREENRIYYESLENKEEDEAESKDEAKSKYARMTEEYELSQKVISTYF